MTNTVISVENLSKTYHLGQIGTGTFSRDLEVWWAKLRGKPNPLLRIGEKDHGNRDGEELWALRDVSFTVQQGEVLGIIGRNGAGKSTLLKILSRVTAPTSGKIKVKGRIASLLEVGTGFHPELTGRENIYLNGAILGMTKQEVTRKFDEIVDFSEVEKFIDTPVKRYSSGMYVRLAFAVAAHLDPEILIVDEVLAVGDAEFQKKCLGKMGDVAKEGRTVLFVSHNMASIRTLCSTCMLIRSGELQYSGSPEIVINEYFSNHSESNLSVPMDLNRYRPKWAAPIITEIHLKNKNGIECKVFGAGSEINIEMVFSSPLSNQIKKPVMGVVVVDKFRGVISKINTRMTGFICNEDFSVPAVFTCQFKEFPITPGQYCFNLWLGDGPVDVDALLDVLDFEIIPTDYYGTGKTRSDNAGIIYLNPVWELKNDIETI